MSKYSADKPDLRNPLLVMNLQVYLLEDIKFEIFKKLVNLVQSLEQ